MNHNIESLMPLCEIETVLAWVDKFRLSRPTKKINRDFSDAVLLAEILSVHYPKLVEMHNYPPRNSHSLKLNNWMTLNRKVLKKLKLGLCCNTMEQLADSTPGVIERVLVMVRDKIRRDEELNRTSKEEGTNVSSGGSYYEACGDEEHILVVPVKKRVNGVLETVQQKVVTYESYCALKVELKDANDVADVLKQKVEHLDNLMKLKDERIDELQSQLERKQARRKEVESQQSTLSVPFESIGTSPCPSLEYCNIPPLRTPSVKALTSKHNKPEEKTSKTKIEEIKIKVEDPKPMIIETKFKADESRIPLPKDILKMSRPCLTDIYDKVNSDISDKSINVNVGDRYSNVDMSNIKPKPGVTDIYCKVDSDISDKHATLSVDNIKSDVFKDIELINEKCDINPDYEEFKDSEQHDMTTIEETIHMEIKDLIKPIKFEQDYKNFAYE